MLLLDVSVVADITPVLPAADVLVTDYSSIAYDFALLARPMLYLTPDLEQYAASRGFYESIEVFCGGSPARMGHYIEKGDGGSRWRDWENTR